MKKILTLTALFALTITMAVAQIQLLSPDGRLKTQIKVTDNKISYSVSHLNKVIMTDQPLSMTFSNGVVVGQGLKAKTSAVRTINEDIRPAVRVKTEVINVNCNEIEIAGKGYTIVFRAYNDAVAYRIKTNFKEKELKVLSEEVAYNFVENDGILFPEEKSFYTHQERKFIDTRLDEIADGRFCSPPMLVTDSPVRMLITEVDLESYPGIYYKKAGTKSFAGIFPHYGLETTKKSDRDLPVTKTADYLAQTTGTRSYPWRVALITSSDEQLLESTTLYSLASKSRIEDTSWIKPGKIAWDWWNANNITGVDFKSGVNTQTYMYFIDFASENNIEYVVLDEGWYDINKNILSIVPDLNMDELMAYAKRQNVGIILWTTWLALEQDKEAAFKQFEKWGIKGLKIDFMQRDDQWMVDWYYEIVKRAADLKMLVDYHGAYTPRGLNATYPNMMTSEGVYGLEQNKWIDDLTPEHNLVLPFTRMVVGPMDYTPGAMSNASKKDFKIRFNRPMSLGTRCHQLGMYVVYESPLQMLSDSPSTYEREPETMRFLSAVPSVWDETRALKAAVGDYVVMARRKGSTWYVGAMNDWTPREIEISLDFLGSGEYTINSWEDGVNADMNSQDFKVRKSGVKSTSKITLKLAAGGGYAAIIRK